MTEDEAKTKWCPFVRYRLTATDVAVNRDQFSDDPLIAICDDDREGPVFNCVASACMAWRSKTTREVNAWSDFVDVVSGYCGLAGAPQ